MDHDDRDHDDDVLEREVHDALAAIFSARGEFLERAVVVATVRDSDLDVMRVLLASPGSKTWEVQDAGGFITAEGIAASVADRLAEE